MEEWKQIEDFNYEVSSSGKVRNIKSGRERKMFPNIKTGYLQVSLAKNSKYTLKYIHRLLAEAFLPNPNNLKRVSHINGNKQDNNLDNLKWV